MSFEENIKDWVIIDNKIKLLHSNIKLLREEKNHISGNIMKYVEDNELSNVNIKISDGNIRFIKTRQAPPLTFKYLEECLLRCIYDKDKVKSILDYIKTSRQCKYIDDIKRTYK